MRPDEEAQFEELVELFENAAGRTVLLTGAGISTESGIPDYRGPTGALRKNTPMTYQAFIADPRARHRYWARSYLGWRQIAAARPNDGHRAVAALQRAAAVAGVITQNVDGLHQAGGARDILELHGGLDRAICLNCGERADRAELDRRLAEANPGFSVAASALNPDGDAEVADTALDGFVMLDCLVCRGGPLKPDVVFFGETVPKDRVERCYDLVAGARALVVLGSSLTVMSGFRFVRRAAELGIPIAIVNLGATRGDRYAQVRIDAPLGRVLGSLASLTESIPTESIPTESIPTESIPTESIPNNEE